MKINDRKGDKDIIRHIVIWEFADNLSFHQSHLNAVKMKYDLENFAASVEGISSFEVIIDPLPASTGNIVLNSLFKDEEALNSYQQHPKHKEIGLFIKATTKNRTSVDYIE